MTNDLSAELKAMAQIEAVLTDLSDEERSRVMQWALSRFRGSGKAPAKLDGSDSGTGDEGLDLSSYETLADFYDAARPVTDADRALVAAYWFQVKDGTPDVESRRVNTELKHLGHGVGNITRAFEALKSAKPAPVIQTRKEGTSQQAQKKFKVTGEGRKAIERLINRARE